MVVKECRTVMLIYEIDISHLMVHGKQIEEEKLKEGSKEEKRAKTGDGKFSHAKSSGHGIPKCGRKHKGKCLAGTNGCFGCGKSGNKMRDCLMLVAKERESKQAPSSGVGSSATKQNLLYALQTSGEEEG
ncbi:uncharacterized protein LOC125869830 [Solanum stenotomum]|uniref:uncharacterized protein LOC125869830 n=1 Tax=Solanum stenotomum TaxID=172797 RepID=UPI0020D058D5|nr:uncharacterized protein LOC125869830 [Solanum stenotomum]